MEKKRSGILYTLKKISILLMQLACSLIAAGIVTCILVLSYLSISPIYLDFLLPYLKPHLAAFAPDVSCTRICLAWREWNHPFQLELENFSIHFPGQQDIHIPHLAVHLDVIKALQGELVISKATLIKATVPLTSRGKDTELLKFDNVSHLFDSSFLQGLSTLVLNDTVFLTPYCPSPIEWPGLSLTLRRKQNRMVVEATLKSHLVARGDISFDPTAKTLSIFTYLQNFPLPQPQCFTSVFSEILSQLGELPIVSGSFDGLYDLEHKKWKVGKGFLTQNKKKTGSSQAFIANNMFLIEGFDAQATLQGDNIYLKHLSLTLNGFAVNFQGTFNQQTAEFSSSLKTSGAINLPLLSRLWPQNIAANPREWIFKNMSEGTVKDLLVSATGKWSEEKEISSLIFSGSMMINDMRVGYLEGMPPVTNACGRATFNPKQFVITLTQGTLEEQKLKKGMVYLGDLDNGNEFLKLDIELEGPLQNVLSIIDNPPLQYARSLHIEPAAFQGQAFTNLKLAFPLKKDLLLQEINVNVDSYLKNVAFLLPIKKGRESLDIQKGELKLNTTTKELSLAGTAQVSGRPAQVFWKEKFHKKGNRLYGLTMSTNPTDFFSSWGINLQKWVSGPFTISLMYRMPKAAQQNEHLEIKADFQQSAIDMPLLNWKKPVGQAANFSTFVDFQTEGKNILKDTHFKATDCEAFGEMTFSQDKTLEYASFSKLRAPAVDATVLFTQDPVKGYALTLTGQSFDFSALFSQDTPKFDHVINKQVPIEFSAHLARGVTGPGTEIRNLIATLKGHQQDKTIEWEQAQISGIVGKGLPLISKKTPLQPGGFLLTFHDRILRVRVNDAGAFLKTLGIHSEIDGGSFVLESQQTDPLKPYEGRIKLKDFEVKDMPLLTRLLALSSPTGLIDLMASNDLRFSEFEAYFSALNEQIIIHEARGVSAGLGITFKGSINQKDKTLFLAGNIIPAAMLNSLLSNIPLVGELFFGGKNSGFLATRFVMKGPVKDPTIEVNPLSSITPGFLKRIFEDDEEEEHHRRRTEQEMQLTP